MPLFRIPRVGDDSAHAVWKSPATGRRRRHAPRDPPSASSTATTLPITCRVLWAGPSSPRRSRGSHAPLILVAATSSRAPREQGRRRAAAGSARERCRSQQLHVFNRVRRESLGHTREGSDRVSRRRASASAAALMQVLTTGRAAQRRGEHGSQQCERCVSRPCLLIVKASCRRLATMPRDDGDALSSAFCCNLPAHAAVRGPYSWLPV